MVQTSRGDIFQAAQRVQLAIVFGHIGFNQMTRYWRDFVEENPSLRHIRDPFTTLHGNPVEWLPGKWLWFVPAQQNHGMTELQLSDALDNAFAWASEKGILSTATNGIANTDHSGEPDFNRRSHEKRAAWLIGYARTAEHKYALNVELVSLNDVFLCASRSALLDGP